MQPLFIVYLIALDAVGKGKGHGTVLALRELGISKGRIWGGNMESLA